MVVLGVNAWDEPAEEVRRFVSEYKLAHRILLAGGAVAQQYGVSALPVVLWIDRAGTVVDAELGFGGAASLEEKTRRLLATAKKGAAGRP